MSGGAGFFGKLPGRGDFVERRLEPALVKRWDEWLASCIVASQQALGERWLDYYLTAPLWSFAAAPGALAERATLGVVMPSVDKVGRYYPLLIAAAVTGDAAPADLLAAGRPWITEAEALLLSSLDEQAMSFEAFDAAVLGLPELPEFDAAATPTVRTGDTALPDTVFTQVSELAQLYSMEEASQMLSNPQASIVWRTEGSEHLPGTIAISAGLPAPEAFPALLSGDWPGCGWEVHGAAPTAQPIAAGQDFEPPRTALEHTTAQFPIAPIPEAIGALEYRSAGVSHSGNARSENQDAWGERSDLGVWLVADGVGGHGAGALASSMATSVLKELAPGSTAQLIASLTFGLRLTQRALKIVANRFGEVANSATTVVALVLQERQATVLWAGDSRAYRLRAGVLTQLMQDHAGDGLGDHNVITRAVGGEAALQLDLATSDVQSGDRFLLCTDGVYRELSEEQLRTLLDEGNAEAACAALAEAVLETPAKDNFTAVLVDCDAPELPPLLR
ncbi:MAG: type VI secretion system-associated protein TagF [Pseudomonadota bacterium]